MPFRKLMHILLEKKKAGILTLKVIDTSSDQGSLGVYTNWVWSIEYQGRQETVEYRKRGDDSKKNTPNAHECVTAMIEANTIYGYGSNWGSWIDDLTVAGPDEDGKYSAESAYNIWNEKVEYQDRIKVLFGDDFDLFMSADQNWDPNYDGLEEDEEEGEEIPDAYHDGSSHYINGKTKVVRAYFASLEVEDPAYQDLHTMIYRHRNPDKILAEWIEDSINARALNAVLRLRHFAPGEEIDWQFIMNDWEDTHQNDTNE